MPSIKTSVSIPQDEATILDKAYDRIFKVSGYPVVTNSEVFRIGLRAILKTRSIKIQSSDRTFFLLLRHSQIAF